MPLFSTIFSIAFPLLLIMDPLGNGALCLTLLRKFSPQKQRHIIRRELCIAFLIIVGFMYLGEALLTALAIGQSTLRVAGGVILFIISLRMVFPQKEGEMDLDLDDPFIVPIAIPFIAGPSCLAAVMVYSHQYKFLTVFLAIFLAWIATAGLMLLMPLVSKFLGKRGLRAMERLMGLILILMSFQMLEDGIKLFISSL